MPQQIRFDEGQMQAVVIIPVKPLAIAKSRLRVALAEQTADLVLAMALDVVTAAVSCPDIAGVLVVTNDEMVRESVDRAGAAAIADQPELGLNQALTSAADLVRSHHTDAIVISQPADCPAVISADFTALLAELADQGGRAFVSYANGSGTTTLIASPGLLLDPHYGRTSRSAHLASGAEELLGARWLRLRQDVDTREDLLAAASLGVARHTQQWMRLHLT